MFSFSFVASRAARASPLRQSFAFKSFATSSTTYPHFKDFYGVFIDGEEAPASNGKTFEVQDPALGLGITLVASGGKDDVDRAVASAQQAFELGTWSRADPRERALVLSNAAALLHQRIETFAEMESQQTGRAVREMKAQLARLPEWFEYFGALIRVSEGTIPPFKGDYLNYVERVPLGVVAQITPWNHPLLIAIKKIAPALAAGNSIVLKPSELAPICVLELAKLLHDAGLPPGVLNCVPGLGVDAGKALSEHEGIQLIDVTGGTPTGRVIGAAAGKNLTNVISELGGKAPMLIFEDADIPKVVNGVCFASFVATGQTCIMGARLLVHESIYDEVVSKVVAKVQKIQMGDPMDPTTQCGPVISGPQRVRVEEFVAKAKEEGAKVLCGGKIPSDLPPHLQSGFYYEPTVIGEVDPKMSIVQEEVFGPVIVAYPFKDEAEAIRLANDSPFGLAAAIWTENVRKAHRVAKKLDVGIIWVNDHHRNDPSSPWGGMKDSGIGRENGIEALHAYSQTKSVVVNYSDDDFDWFVTEDVRYS